MPLMNTVLTNIQKQISTQWLITLSAVMGLVFWRPLGVFFIPGILIIFCQAATRVPLTCLLLFVMGTSLSFWIASFWVLKFLPLSLTHLYLLTAILTASLLIYYLLFLKQNVSIVYKRHDAVLLVIFSYILILRLLPLYDCIAPSGADMSMHSYITALIVKHNGIPNNYYPILGIQEFSSFPVGFHTISALIALVGDMQAYKGAFIMSCLTYFFLTAFLFTFLRAVLPWDIAILSSVAFTFFTENPQGFIGWGGNPTIFALAFLLFFLSTIDKINTDTKLFILLSSLALAAIFLTHSIIFVQSFYIVGFSQLVYFLFNKTHRTSHWFKYGIMGALFVAIILPYLSHFNFSIATEHTQTWIKNWVRNSGHVWQGNLNNFVWTIPAYIVNYIFGKSVFWYSLFACFAGLCILFRQNQKLCIQHIAFFAACVLLILNAKYWLLPLSYAVYPERVATMAVIPLSVLFAYAIDRGMKSIKQKHLHAAIKIFLILAALRLSHETNQLIFIDRIKTFSPLTKEDVKAFMWLDEHAKENDIIRNNYGDAGLWIPAVIFRGVTHPHVNVVYLDKMKSLGSPKYVYIGSKCVYPESCQLNNDLYKDNEKYKLVYHYNKVYIYQLR